MRCSSSARGSARPASRSTDGNAPAVAAICTELDGLPLAIELAAARVRVLSLEQIATRLADRFRLLTGGAAHRAAAAADPARLGRLEPRAALAEERALLRRLAVFAGGFTLEAAEEVCAGEGIERDDVLDLLGSLVDQSLVIAEEREGGVRYRLLETVRQYGLERLGGGRRGDACATATVDHFLALAEDDRPARWGRCASEWHSSCSTPRPPTWPRRSTAPSRPPRSEPCASALALSAGGGARRFARGGAGAFALAGVAGGAVPAGSARTAFHSRSHIALGCGRVRSGRRHATRGAGRSPRRSATREPPRGRAVRARHAMASRTPPRGERS